MSFTLAIAVAKQLDGGVANLYKDNIVLAGGQKPCINGVNAKIYDQCLPYFWNHSASKFKSSCFYVICVICFCRHGEHSFCLCCRQGHDTSAESQRVQPCVMNSALFRDDCNNGDN